MFVADLTVDDGVVNFGMFCLDHITDLQAGASKIKRWRTGRIVVENGKLIRLEHRLLSGSVSMAQVWWQAKFGRYHDRVCWLDYHQPIGMPSFLTLDYVRSGSQAGYRSFAGAVHLLHEVARIRQAQAIVAHVSNGRISDRFLKRVGWEEHCESWQGRHWIRRFYDGYPDPSKSDRYQLGSV